jgi:serine/threonine protein kinase
LAAGTAAALSAVHEAGVVHRDVKPQNVILAPSGPMMLDFGIAHALDGTSVTRTGVMTGTPGWISPEHYRTGTVGPEGDVFAWGALVAYAATGRLPFGSGAADAVAFRVLSAEPDLNGMGDDLRQLVMKALSKEPSGRPAASELAQACGELLAGQATAVTGPADLPQPTLIADLVGLNWDLPSDEPNWPGPLKRPGRTRLYLAVVAAAALVGSLGGVLAATQSSSTVRGPGSASGSQRTPAASLTPAAQRSASPATGPALDAASGVPSSSRPSPRSSAAPSPAYTRSDDGQPTVEEWAAARVPATQAEKAAAQRLREGAAPVLQGQQYMGDEVTVTFNPAAQTMFVTFGPGVYPEGQSYQDDVDWTDVVRGLMFGSCAEAQQDFHDDITWPYGRAAVVYRESMASPLIADFREVTHTDSCRV